MVLTEMSSITNFTLYSSGVRCLALTVALLAVTACGQRRQETESASSAASPAPVATQLGAIGATQSPLPIPAAAPVSQANGLKNHYIMKVPLSPDMGTVNFTVSINGEAPMAFSAANSESDITAALHAGRNDLVVGWETNASTNNIKELRIGEHTPDGKWNTVFSISVGTQGYGRFPSKGTRKYSIYAR